MHSTRNRTDYFNKPESAVGEWNRRQNTSKAREPRRTGRIFYHYGEHYEHEETTPSDRNVDRDRYGAGSPDACFENADLDLHSMNPHSTFLSILVALIVLYIVAMFSERRR